MNKRIIFASSIILIILILYLLLIFQRVTKDNNIVNNDNKVMYKEISEKDIAQIYLNDFYEIANLNKREAYNLLDNDYKRKITYEEFNEMFNEYDELEMKSYKVEKKENYKLYYIKDINDNTYVFKEKSIMNYSVYLDENSI